MTFRFSVETKNYLAHLVEFDFYQVFKWCNLLSEAEPLHLQLSRAATRLKAWPGKSLKSSLQSNHSTNPQDHRSQSQNHYQRLGKLLIIIFQTEEMQNSHSSERKCWNEITEKTDGHSKPLDSSRKSQRRKV